HALPALVTLRKHYPAAYIAWAVEEKSSALLVGNPYLDEVILFERKKIIRQFKNWHWIRGWKELHQFKKKLRTAKFDISLDLQGLARSAFVVYLAKAKKRIGCYGMRELSELISPPPKSGNPNAHAVDRSLQVVQALDKNIVPILEFPIVLDEADKQFAAEFLQQSQVAEWETIIGINLGASIPLNIWQKEKFAQLIYRLRNEEQFRIILFGGPTDISFANAVCSLTTSNPISVVGKTTLKQLAALTQHCAVFVSGDTAPLHIAAAMGTPVVAIFGPANPNKTGPYTDKKRVIWKKPECSPCFKKTEPECPYNVVCMQQISVEDVLAAIGELLHA
ncbi:MAG: glycosyltransferase family 9 protein, partial [bacterium]|nr:glycosyltransferase family 9 protein [bacterium]